MILLKNKDKKANIKIGNNIEIKDGSDFPFDLTLYGKSTQETTTGKNLFDKNNGTTSGATKVVNGEKISITGQNGFSLFYWDFDVSNINQIVLSGKIVSGNYAKVYLTLDGIAKRAVEAIGDFSYTLDTTSNTTARLYLYANKGQTIEQPTTSVYENIMISANGGDYEPYTGGQPSPSPDFPSPIESVGRKNLFDYTKLNNENTVQWKAYENLGIMFRALPIYVGKNKQVYFSSNVPALTSENAFYAINNINEGSSNILNVDNSRVVSSNSDGYVYLGVVTNRQYYEDVQNNVYWIMISTDNIEYLPYEHTEISAEVTNANQWNNDLVINATKSTDGFTMADKWAVPLMTQSNVLNTFKPDTTYTIKVVSKVLSKPTTLSPNQSRYDILLYRSTPWSYFALNLYDKVNAKVGDINTTYTTITTPSDLHDFNLGGYCFFGNNDGSTTYKGSGSIEIQQIMLAEGEYTKDNFPDYVHYASNSLTIDLQGNELCSLPNGTKDEVNITNGEALLIKRIGKVVLDGSENWVKYQDYLYYYNESFKLSPTTSYVMPDLISDNFTISTFNNLRNNPNIYMSANQLGSPNNQRGVSLYVNDYYSDVSTLKSWLSTHNVEVLYELAEPETINLGTVEMPHTYEGISNITNSADTEMVVKYYKKFEFDKILRSGYNIDEQEYEIAKKQMANGKRKKILSSYVDCIIKIDLGLLDNKTYQEYKEQLEDGEYEYWSYKYNQYKKANFILTKPSITTEYAYDDEIGIDDMEITLEKSSDVS